MMAVVVLLIFVQLVSAGLTLTAYVNSPAARDRKAVEAGTRMARLLDQAAGDPITPTTDRWMEQARRAADEWFDNQGGSA